MRWLLLLALCGCVTPGRPAPPRTSYDFGVAAASLQVARPVSGSLVVADVAAPEWLVGDGIIYRLAYENEARPAVYSRSRWVASPAQLLTERLIQRLSGLVSGGVARSRTEAPADYLLRAELEEFSQIFDAPESSRVLVRMRATLLGSGGVRLAQQVFEAEKPAAPDAAGAATGLREASDQLIDELGAWLLKEAKAAEKSFAR